MKQQASQLRIKTKNILEAEVRTSPLEWDRSDERDEDIDTGGWIQHDFLIVAPALDRYQYKLFHAVHAQNLVYPVSVHGPGLDGDFSSASTEFEFTKCISKILNSNKTRSVVQSLVARINDLPKLF